MADVQEGIQRYILLIFVLSASEVVSAEQPCGSLVFPTEFDSTVLHQPEHTQVVIPFEESEEGCTDEPDDTGNKIVVEKKISDGVFTNLCTILLVNGSCSTDSTGDADCVCLEEKGKYEFRKNVTREDTGLTLAFASTKGAKTKDITFDITYPAVITELELNSRGPDEEPVPLERNKSLDVACRWENGNPPVTARLLDRHGNTVDDSVKSEDIQHTFPRVSCQDAGLIRCEAPGASQNKTATLLVKCPPEFTDPNLKTLQVNTGTADVTFGVRTHTTMFQNCSVTMTESGGNVPANGTSVTTSLSAAGSFTCSSLTGTPPDLTLTVSMKSIKKQDEGTWRLELANDVGTDHLDFVLAVTETVGGSSVGPVTLAYHTDAPTTKGTTHADEDSVSSDSSAGSSGGGGGGTVAAVVIVLLIIVAVVVVGGVIFYRRRRAQQQDKGYTSTPSSE